MGAQGIVGAVPTFIFHGNKAEVLLLGSQCAEVVPVSSTGLPQAAADEGLGRGIQRTMRYARTKGALGGWPTHRGDGSLLLVHAKCAHISMATGVGETVEGVLTEHRSAIALAQVARWAQSKGALYGLPTFTAKSNKRDALEVLVIGKRLHATTSEPRFIVDQGTPVLSALTLAGMFTCVSAAAWSF